MLFMNSAGRQWTIINFYRQEKYTKQRMNSNLEHDHCQTSTLRTRTEMVFETLVCSPLNHLTRLIARENFIMIKYLLTLTEF
jgi:hypothetical protein